MTNQSAGPKLETLYVTRRYTRLQGLRSVLSGVFFVALGLFTGVSASDSADGRWFASALVIFVLVAAVCVWGDLRIKSWYQERFGVAQPHRKDVTFDWVSAAVVGIVFAAGALLAALTPLTYPIAFVALALGALGLQVAEIRRFRGWRPYVLAYGIGAGVIALVTWRLGLREPQSVNTVVFICFGLAMIAGGTADHRMLTQALGDRASGEDVI